MILIPLLISIVLIICFFIYSKKSDNYLQISFYYFLFIIVFSSMYLLTKDNGSLFYSWVTNLFALLFYVALISIPVAFYNYIRSISNTIYKKSNFWKDYSLQSLLLIINICCFIYLTLAKDESSFMFQISSEVMNYSNFIAILFIFPILNLFYLIKTVKYYRIYLHKKNENIFYENTFSRQWMLIDIISYIILIISLYTLLAVNLSGGLFTIIFNSIVTAYLLLVGYRTLNKRFIINNKIELVDRKIGEEKNKLENFDQVKKSIDSKIIDNIKTKLNFTMENEKPYLNEALTINKLSKIINSNSKYVSYTLNSSFGQNFPAFINSYRAREAKLLLSDKENNRYTIEAISKMAGFKSKSVFNTFFKSKYGETPSQYRYKQNLITPGNNKINSD